MKDTIYEKLATALKSIKGFVWVNSVSVSESGSTFAADIEANSGVNFLEVEKVANAALKSVAYKIRCEQTDLYHTIVSGYII